MNKYRCKNCEAEGSALMTADCKTSGLNASGHHVREYTEDDNKAWAAVADDAAVYNASRKQIDVLVAQAIQLASKLRHFDEAQLLLTIRDKIAGFGKAIERNDFDYLPETPWRNRKG